MGFPLSSYLNCLLIGFSFLLSLFVKSSSLFKSSFVILKGKRKTLSTVSIMRQTEGTPFYLQSDSCLMHSFRSQCCLLSAMIFKNKQLSCQQKRKLPACKCLHKTELIGNTAKICNVKVICWFQCVTSLGRIFHTRVWVYSPGISVIEHTDHHCSHLLYTAFSFQEVSSENNAGWGIQPQR